MLTNAVRIGTEVQDLEKQPHGALMLNAFNIVIL
jgi:hypothetical protein